MRIKQTLKPASGRPSILNDERGLSTVEYVVLLVLICAGCVGLWASFGQDVYTKLQGASDEFSTTVDSDYGDSGTEDSPGK